MIKIIKHSDSQEEFSKSNISNSVMNAGISKVTSEAISESIHYREGMATAEVRNRIVSGIKNREPQTDRQFEWHPRKTHNA